MSAISNAMSKTAPKYIISFVDTLFSITKSNRINRRKCGKLQANKGNLAFAMQLFIYPTFQGYSYKFLEGPLPPTLGSYMTLARGGFFLSLMPDHTRVTILVKF